MVNVIVFRHNDHIRLHKFLNGLKITLILPPDSLSQVLLHVKTEQLQKPEHFTPIKHCSVAGHKLFREFKAVFKANLNYDQTDFSTCA